MNKDEQEYILNVSKIVFIYMQTLRFNKKIKASSLSQEDFIKIIVKEII